MDNEKRHIAHTRLPWNHFRRNRPAVWSMGIIVFFLFIALAADFIANDKPLYCRYHNESFFPVLHDYPYELGIAQKQNIEWKKVSLQTAIWPPVRYLPHELDYDNAQFVSPFAKQNIKGNAWKHRLGTDALGQDVLAGLIHGTRIAFAVGVFSMIIASALGLLFGLLAGYFGDRGMKISRASVITGLLFLFPAFFYGYQCRAFILEDALKSSAGQLMIELAKSKVIFFGVMGIGYIASRPLRFIPLLGKKVHLPLDIIISRFIEVFNSIPRLLLIFSLIILIKPSLYLVTIVIGLTSWTEIARFIRAEMLRIRGLEYIESAQALGYSRTRIMLRHALPNALAPVLITISFGIAGAILAESSLSFLGIGVPIDSLTWGKLLAEARQAPQAWWLAIFPGLAIFLTVTAFNLIGDGLTEAIDPRSIQNRS